MSKKEEVYVPQEPTYRLEAEIGNVVIKAKLYGDITPERLEREKQILAYRAEQMQP